MMNFAVEARPHGHDDADGKPFVRIAETLYRSSAIALATAYQTDRLDSEVRVRSWREVPITSRGMSDDERPRAVLGLVRCLYLYGGYEVKSRGPSGLIMDAITMLRPDLGKLISETGDDEILGRIVHDLDPVAESP